MQTSRRPAALVINPATDAAFRRDVDRRLRAGVASPEALAEALRDAYPKVVARRRELSGEQHEVWYVYRDGVWRSHVPEAESHNDARDDFRATSESLAADAKRVRAIERRSARLEDADPRLEDLARQSDDLTQDMAAKSARQAELLRESRRPADSG